ncbi:MAG TPA: lytic murein transglycosylase [Xanthobacteraceae bacterium]|nr:lytic murein transglycosylase [Xanthobacteraceae bacterium]
MSGWFLSSAGGSGLVGPAAAVAAMLLAVPWAQAQDDRFPRPPLGTTATAAPAAVSPGEPGALPWSGEPGSSGDPQMMPDAIRAAAANFHHCLEGLWPAAARRGVSRQTFEAQTADLEPDLRIMDLLDAQPEFTKSFWDYLDLLVTDARIAKGREILAAHGATFDAVEKAYGVDRHIVTAIWGVESNFGTAVGERSVVRSTATLACIGRRQAYFRDEFLATLEILEHGDVSADRLKGSWAGAFGPTQFMPTAFKRYAVDFDGDGRRDVVDSVPDVIASTANNLKKDGWSPGQTWGYEVIVPKGFNYLLADRSRLFSLSEWERLGVRRVGNQPFAHPADRAYLLVPAGVRGPGFLMLNNFRVIMKYNPAEAYALAIGHLADRLRGGGPIVQPWPRDERVLTRAEVYELQQRLVMRGFDAGEPNGRFGAKSRAALRDFQARAGLIPDGFASAAMLERLRGR